MYGNCSKLWFLKLGGKGGAVGIGKTKREKVSWLFLSCTRAPSSQTTIQSFGGPVPVAAPGYPCGLLFQKKPFDENGLRGVERFSLLTWNGHVHV